MFLNYKQTDPAFNIVKAWPKDLFPEVNKEYFADCGCFVTCITIMLKQQNLVDDDFTPWSLHQQMLKHSGYSACGNLLIDCVLKLYPLDYLGDFDYSFKKVKTLSSDGAPFFFEVPGINSKFHYVAFKQIVKDDIEIYDPIDKYHSLAQIKDPKKIVLFKVNPYNNEQVCLETKHAPKDI